MNLFAKLVAAVGAVVVPAAMAAPAATQQAPPAAVQGAAPGAILDAAPAPVTVDEVRQEAFAGTVPVIGRLVARQAGEVAARIAGPVAEIRVEIGDRVKEGEVIAVLIPDRLEAERNLAAAEVAEATAKHKTAEAVLALARQELKRLRALRKSAAFSQARFDDKRQEVVKLESEVAEAKASQVRSRANLRLREIDLYNAKIRAPYGGVVSLRHTEAGAYVGVGSPVVTLINDGDLEIEADVPAGRVAAIPPGTVVEARLAEGLRGEATVRAIIPDENPRTRTRAVRFTIGFEPPEGGFAINQNVVVDIPIGKARRITSVHKDAVINRHGKNIVFVVENGAVQVRPVRLGEAVGNRFVVEDGLRPGELVVVRGNERLLPGQKVRAERRL